MGKKADRVRPEPDREPRAQYAAVPWRKGEDGIEVLLLTSRETRRWVLPKGWPIKGLKPGPSAAQEAFEEAGVSGKVTKKPIGVYHYDKRLRSGRSQHVRVSVFPLEVTTELEEFPEVGQREKEWLPPKEAAVRVDEPELKTLLAGFRAK
jgi:8-oxo-dGTP pyrophosphatase MutT (NUDIX family)